MEANQVYQGDCLELMPAIPAQSIDMILCDLPYGITPNPWDTVIDLPRLWQQYRRILRPGGVIALTASGVFTAHLILSNPAWYKYKIVWIKSKSTNFLNAKKQPLRRHEDICIFYTAQPKYQPQMIAGQPYNKGCRRKNDSGCYGNYHSAEGWSNGPRYPYDIVCFDEDADDWFYCKTCEHEATGPIHPTQKPVDLGRYLIRTYTRPGALVLDNACGCGSFLVAAIRENRRFIGIEKNEQAYQFKLQPTDFINVCRQRIAQEMANQSLTI